MANIIAMLVQFFLEPAMGGQRMIVDGMPTFLPRFIEVFGFIPGRVFISGWVWQVFTHMFLHGGLFHIFFNMFALYIFGPHVERSVGPKKFLVLYLISGLGAVMLQSFLFFDSFRPMIGASGAVFGIAAAFAYLFPRSKLLVFGIFPVLAWKLIAVYAAFELFMTLNASRSLVAHAAHFGGIVTGLLFMQLVFRRYSLGIFSRKKSKPGAGSGAEMHAGTKPQKTDRWGKVIELEKDEDGWWR